MKRIVILGAGSGGTMLARHLFKKLPHDLYKITLIDPEPRHYYQPGFLFIPFDQMKPEDCYRQKTDYIPKGIQFKHAKASLIKPGENHLLLDDGQEIHYDLLVVATGTRIAPEETPGMLGDDWHKNIFDFYTFEGAMALRDKLRDWEGGKLVVHITETPIKCPVAPLEFAFLSDAYFADKGMRDKVEITYVTPLSGAFTKPIAAEKLGHLLDEKQIQVVTDFSVMEIDNTDKKLISYDGIEVPYDLLVTVPTNLGDPVISDSGLGNDFGFLPVHKNTLQHEKYHNIFSLGDATNAPTSKAGSVAHFQAELLAANIVRYLLELPVQPDFDGHANCFVETGHGKALLLDFNYDTEPVEGTFPIAGIGPMQLLNESRMNHMGKLAFHWIYFHMLLEGKSIPMITPQMQKSGKHLETIHP
jgi:sulfide:quinone oxidoreductase